MIVRILYFIYIISVLESCASKADKKSNFKIIETYPNGAIKLTHTPKNDSVFFREEYYENGNHKTAVFVKNNKFDGRWEAYTIDEDKMLAYGDYKDGKKVGEWRYIFWEDPSHTVFINYLTNGDSTVKFKYH